MVYECYISILFPIPSQCKSISTEIEELEDEIKEAQAELSTVSTEGKSTLDNSSILLY